MMLSVCVATRGDVDRLTPFFESVRALKVSRPWELLVVYNSPSPPPATEIKRQTQGLPLVLLHESQSGKSRALNRAITVARGDWLVFTDDDVQHRVDWLDKLVAAAESSPWASVIGGRILSKGSVPTWIRRSSNLQALLLCEHDLGDLRQCYPKGLYPYGPNMAVSRRQLEATGAHWPEGMGPGTRLPVGDEYGFLAQISRADGTDRLYVADAIVYHNVQPQYFLPNAAIRRSFQCGFAAGKLKARFGSVENTPTIQRAFTRLMGLRSSLELACVTARATGLALGRYFGSGF
ncbi:MAG: glycosyltransferase [Nevskiales bacterium]|nr:glycosyltransferase [Nevskiales bacterium]